MSALQTAVVAACSGALACVATILLVTGSTPGIPATDIDTAELARIADALARLHSDIVPRLDRLEAQAVPRPERREVPQSAASAEQASFAEALAELQLTLEQLRSGAGDAVVEGLVPRTGPIDWSSLLQLHDLAQRDRDAARRSVVLLTVAEVVMRYGFPNHVEPSQNSYCDLYVGYHRIGADGERNGHVRFDVKGGFVTGFDMHMP